MGDEKQPALNKQIRTTDDLQASEIQIIYMIRNLRLFDKVEISYVKRGEIGWRLTQSDSGKLDIDIR